MFHPVRIVDLEDRFRPLSEGEQGVAQALLDDAWAMLLTVVPSLGARRNSGQVSDGLLISVLAAMTLRVLRNPEGIRQWSVDDASFTRDSTLSAGGLYVSDAEVALLNGSAGRRGGAFSIAPAAAQPSHSRGAEWPRW